jgi:hypothetical protein
MFVACRPVDPTCTFSCTDGVPAGTGLGLVGTCDAQGRGRVGADTSEMVNAAGGGKTQQGGYRERHQSPAEGPRAVATTAYV